MKPTLSGRSRLSRERKSWAAGATVSGGGKARRAAGAVRAAAQCRRVRTEATARRVWRGRRSGVAFKKKAMLFMLQYQSRKVYKG